MFKRTVVLFAASMLCAGSAFCQEKAFQTPEECIQYADASYADHALTLDARREVMIRVLQAADTWKDNYDVQWRAAQASHAFEDMVFYRYQIENYEAALGRNEIRGAKDVLERSLAMSPAQSRSLLELGTQTRALADRAVQLKPGGAEGHYYSAVGIGTYSYGKSIVKALLEGLGPKFEEHLNRVLAVNKEYRDGAAYTAFGRYYYKLPWPKKNIKRSLDLLRSAEACQPQDIIVLDFLGDALLESGDKAGAVRSWQAVLASPRTTYHAAYLKALTEAKLKYAQ